MEPHPDALAYAALLHQFLWTGAAPALLSIIGCSCCIKIIRRVMEGLW